NMFQALHGDGGSTPGFLGTGTNQVTEFEFFRSAYNFFRDLVIYEDFVNTYECVGGTTCCWLTADDYGYTAAGFQVRYFENTGFEAFLDGDTETFAGNELDSQCDDYCDDMAIQWASELYDSDCILASDTLEVEAFFAAICKLGCDVGDIGIGSSSGDGTDVTLYGQSFDNFQEVIDYYSTQCTGCTGSCGSIVFPTVDYAQQDCECEKVTDFVQAYYDEYGYTGDIYDPITVILNASPAGDTADFHAELDDILSGDEVATDFDIITELDSWLDACSTAVAFTDTLALAFQCGSYQDLGDTNTTAQFLIDCGDELDALANYYLFLAYEQQLKDSANKFIETYKKGCFEGMDIRERYTMSYTLKEYHYTLYFYDQADNLIKTVPPSGVYQADPNDSTDVFHNSLISATNGNAAGYLLKDIVDYRNGVSTNYVHPDHTMITNYKYNSLQKLTEQTTPDGGTSEFWYDALDRIVLSRNAIQLGATLVRFSYTLFDELGRVEESGEIEDPNFGIYTNTYDDIQTIARDDDMFLYPTSNLLYNFINSGTKTEVSHTFYDETMNPTVDGYFTNGQEFLRTRISSVTYEEVDDANDNTFDQASHYSYDIHGNVSILKQQNNDLAGLGQDLKTVTYDYDLISGNVNQVNYQAGKFDEFYHRYCYDADNRITEAFTSRDGMLWELDEKQLYYAHGPLARKELGDRQVQARDHVYNAQGWLKAINSSTGNEIHDAGEDGVLTKSNQYFGRDANGFSLHYFDGDYTPIGTGANSNVLADLSNTTLITDAPQLYNGNIMSMVTGLKDNNESAIEVFANAYQYDQLNRIKGMNVYKYKTGTKPYDNATFSNSNSEENGDYRTRYRFDGNGNLHSLSRRDNANVLMDGFEYNFYGASYGDSKKTHNKLEFVYDTVTGTSFGDIEKGQVTANYDYDAIGQLTDDVQECISNIEWDVRNKVLRIVRPDLCQRPGAAGGVYPSDVEFHYDALGQRVMKIEMPRTTSGYLKNQVDWIYTYYVRDASGNVMGVYK
ncbi:MAG: hypothetical protein JKY54_11070, partial [Flavobacteriales bacterium]|nr:hypothetical protein [Flavobacteriales bacterium]